MAIYRTIQLSFWTDNKIVDDFTPEDKYFYLYLLSNPQTNLCGCYEISLNTMSIQTGYSKEAIQRLLERFEQYHKIIKYSKSTREILILNWHKYNWTRSPKLDKPLTNEINKVKNSEFREILTDLYNNRSEREIPYPYGMDTSVTVTVNNTTNSIYKDKSKGIDKSIGIDNNSKLNIDNNIPNIENTKNHFIKPTVEQVKAYCEERGNGIDAETFVDFYESKGWMVGKNKMKDWKACIRTWERKDGRASNKEKQRQDEISRWLNE